MADHVSRFTVAAIQMAPVYLNREATLEKAINIVEETANRGASFIVFPEAWVSGFPFWYSHVASWDYPPIKKTYARLYKNAVDIPGDFTEALCNAAKQAEVYIAIGVNERVTSGTMYNTLLFIGRDGSLIGKHRKLVPTFHERMVWAHGDGSTLQVFDTELGRIGGLICWEHWMPLGRYSLYSQAMQICASVWPGIGSDSLAPAQHMAFEGGCFVVLAGSYVTRAHLPADFELMNDIDDVPDTILPGGSTIIGPDGKCIVDPVYDKEEIVYAEIDLEKILEQKQTLDTAGHYSRPEVLKLIVNREPFSSYEIAGDREDLRQEITRLVTMAEEAPDDVLRESIRKLRGRFYQ